MSRRRTERFVRERRRLVAGRDDQIAPDIERRHLLPLADKAEAGPFERLTWVDMRTLYPQRSTDAEVSDWLCIDMVGFFRDTTNRAGFAKVDSQLTPQIPQS